MSIPYSDGVRAALAGRARTDNPHEPGTAEHWRWDSGFLWSIDEDDLDDLDWDEDEE